MVSITVIVRVVLAGFVSTGLKVTGMPTVGCSSSGRVPHRWFHVHRRCHRRDASAEWHRAATPVRSASATRRDFPPVGH